MLYREEDIPFFSKEVVNLRLFLTHVERLFFGRPYFAATSLFVIPFSKSLKALKYFTPIGLLFNLCFPLAKNQEWFVWIHDALFMFLKIECMIEAASSPRNRYWSIWRKFIEFQIFHIIIQRGYWNEGRWSKRTFNTLNQI